MVDGDAFTAGDTARRGDGEHGHNNCDGGGEHAQEVAPHCALHGRVDDHGDEDEGSTQVDADETRCDEARGNDLLAQQRDVHQEDDEEEDGAQEEHRGDGQHGIAILNSLLSAVLKEVSAVPVLEAHGHDKGGNAQGEQEDGQLADLHGG